MESKKEINKLKIIICNTTNNFNLIELKEIETLKEIKVLISNLNATDNFLLLNSNKFIECVLRNKIKL